MRANQQGEDQARAESGKMGPTSRLARSRLARSRIPGFRLPRYNPPWILPPSMTPTDQLSQEELVREARESRPLLREIGWRDSAVAHPSLTNIQYLRTVQFLGRFPVRPYVLQVLLTLGVGAGLALLFFFGPTQQEDSELALSGARYVYSLVGGMVGLVFGTGMGYSARCLSQFNTAYASARIAQKHNGRTVAILELPMLRMAFVDHAQGNGNGNGNGNGGGHPYESLFSGVENRSGFANGRMNLETGLQLSAVTDPRQFQEPGAIRPSASTFTGVHTSRRHSLLSTAKEMGRINAEKQMNRSKGKDLLGMMGEHKGMTFFLVSAAISLFVLAAGVEVDFSKPGALLGG